MLVCSGVTAREEGRCFGVGIIKYGRFCARIESEEKAQAMRGVIAGPGGYYPEGTLACAEDGGEYKAADNARSGMA